MQNFIKRIKLKNYYYLILGKKRTMVNQNPKEVFKKCGTCSQTFAHLLNREFRHPKEEEERAMTPLAGGIVNEGHQCGMLWGAALAIGEEAFHRHEDREEAIATTVTATKHIIESFVNRTKTVNCREIIGTNLNNLFGLVSYMIKTMTKGINNSQCFNLAEQWAPEAIQAGKEGLSEDNINLKHKPVSCAAEVVKRMGGTDEEMTMVSGFAGGLGLSGNACGALSAAIWMKTLEWCKENPGKTPPMFNNSIAKKLLKSFKKVTNSEMLCQNITRNHFETIDDHSKYINAGGCKELMETLLKN
jgi:C_GCAxxG_C_C family probable redox protein